MTACDRHDPPGTGAVLVVDDHAQARDSMADVLRRAGHGVTCCASGAEALQTIERQSPDCIVTDLKMPGMSGLELIRQLAARRCPAQVVMVTAHASVATAVEAMRHGAFDYIEKPFAVDQLEDLVAQAIRHGRLVRPETTPALGNDRAPADALAAMVGSSPVMQALRAKIAQVAPTPETVLISGESGTGKELVARAIHAQSDRAAGPLVSLNCPVLSAHLMESELFGHERGAFTGAEGPRAGRFELADSGTILLDEVTEIDLGLQAKLLRVLQERAFERVGSSRTIRVDVRVVATTNRDLQEAVDAGRFRADLYYRLAVVPLAVPPLRDRREDIPELVDHFLARSAARLHRDPPALDRSAIELLEGHDWPGNVRQLENILTRASVLYAGQAVTADVLRRWLGSEEGEPRPPSQASDLPLGMSLEEIERRMIEATLRQFGGHREKTAKALGIGVRTLSGKLRQYGYAPRAKEFSGAG